MNQEGMLNTLRPWLLRKAASFSRDPATQQDLAQEGWIAAWKLASSGADISPENLIVYAKVQAKQRMLDILRQGKLTGMSDRRPGAVVKHVATPHHFDDSDGFRPIWQQLHTAAEQLELAYHDGEIEQAISELSPRQAEYVRLRFWEGWTIPELDGHFGTGTTHIWSKTQKTLSGVLAHMATSDEKPKSEPVVLSCRFCRGNIDPPVGKRKPRQICHADKCVRLLKAERQRERR